jgi:hypothetical protein
MKYGFIANWLALIPRVDAVMILGIKARKDIVPVQHIIKAYGRPR